MKNWFWSKVKFTDESYKASFWSKCDDTKIKLNITSLEESFGKKKKDTPSKTGKSGSESSTSSKPKKKEKISIVDGKRQQNCGIALKRFRMPFSKLKDIMNI